MTEHAWPQVSASYGSICRVEPQGRCPKQGDRIAVCPGCNHARRIDQSNIFYAHEHDTGHRDDELSAWLNCRLSGHRFVPAAEPLPDLVVRPLSRPEFAARRSPRALTPEVLGTTQSSNRASIAECEDLIEKRLAFVETHRVGVDHQHHEIQRLRARIDEMLQENDFVERLLAA